MSKRKLPRAIRRHEDSEAPAAAAPDVAQAAAWEPARSLPERERTEEALPLRTGPILTTASVPAERPRSVPVRYRPPEHVNAVRRRAQALAIVERHATYSAAGGIIPVPIVNVASIMAIIVRMVRSLSKLYGVPFEQDRARAIIVALAGGTLPTGFAAITTSTLYYVLPGAALFGLAVSCVTATTCTRNIGRIFVEHFERGESLDDLPVMQEPSR